MKPIATIFALLIFFSATAQSKHGTSLIDYRSLIVQGLSDESILPPQYQMVQLKKLEVEQGRFIEYAEKGNSYGLPVILLHGLADSWRSFEKVLPLLPDSLRLIIPTQRGHGDADKTFSKFTPADFAADAARLMQKLNIPSAVVVGHSMGGVVAQQLAIHYPHLVKALVIGNSDARWSDNPGVVEFAEQVMQLQEPMSEAFMHQFQRASLANELDTAFYQTLFNESMKMPVAVFQAAMQGMLQQNLLPLLPQIKVPVLLLWGNKDDVCRLQDQQEMLKALPEGKLIIYEGIGHALHWEAPDRFAQDVVEFVKSVTK